MNIPKIEEAITLLYQTYIQDQNVATQRGIAITAMNEMVKLLGGEDVVKKIEAVPYSARLRAQHFFEDEPQPKREWIDLTPDQTDELARSMVKGDKSVNWLVREINAKLKELNECNS